MTYDFDNIRERRGTGALKYDVLQERYGNAELLPLWVADMDFDTPPFIINAIRKRLDHPILGYTVTPPEFWQAIKDWTFERHGWALQREWMTFVPGIVKGIGLAINRFSAEGESIIIQSPVYHIFRMVIEGNKRKVADNPLLLQPDGTYRMNFEQLEELAAREDCKMMVLSNPHNPAGIVWTEEVLRKVAEICHRHEVLVISDEIHCDMTLRGFRHIPFATVSDEACNSSITFMAPTKTFNMAGIVSSYAIVPSLTIRERFFSWLDANELTEPTIFAPIATIAAYQEGNSWREQMLAYIEGNIDYTIDYCETNLPGIKALRPEVSFLVWLDCRGLGLSHSELVELFEEKAGLALNDGEMFGAGGEGFMRINVGAPRAIISEALSRLRTALSSLRAKKEKD